MVLNSLRVANRGVLALPFITFFILINGCVIEEDKTNNREVGKPDRFRVREEVNTKLRRVEKGMTEKEVEDIFGPPDEEVKNQPLRVPTPRRNRRSPFIVKDVLATKKTWLWKDNIEVIIWFDDGAVIWKQASDYGRDPNNAKPPLPREIEGPKPPQPPAPPPLTLPIDMPMK